MIDSATHKPLKVSFDAATGPYIWVSVAQLDRLRQVLVQHDIRHWVDNYPVSVDGEPAVTKVYVRKGIDPVRVQTVLDAAA
jgi:hypothetical protein